MFKRLINALREIPSILIKLAKESYGSLKKTISPWWLLLGLLFIPIIFFDNLAIQILCFPVNSPAHKVAQFISDNGDFYKGCILIIALLFVVGALFEKRKLRVLALAMILSCASAGILSLGIRIISGRPRPSLNAPDGLYGPRFANNRHGFMFFDYDYQSFPSGHATTAFATAVPALIIAPAIGIPITVGAVFVAWARFQLKRHNPSDLYAGLLMGTFFGIILGKAAKKLSVS